MERKILQLFLQFSNLKNFTVLKFIFSCYRVLTGGLIELKEEEDVKKAKKGFLSHTDIILCHKFLMKSA